MRSVTLAAVATFALAGGVAAWADNHGQGHDMMQHMQSQGAGHAMQGGDMAEEGMSAHGAHGDPAVAAGPDTPAVREYREAMDTMMRAMDVPYTGDADVDFANGMIAHHQGAIDMAEVVLRHGKDPEIRKLAETVIEAQTQEITWMRNWLQQHAR